LDALIYYLVIPLIYLLSLLPFPLLYLFSDFLYFVFYYIIGYRKKVVLQNLRNAFPEKSDEEINAICKGFFHFFCDFFVETFKTLTISKKSMLRHCKWPDETSAVFSKLADDGKSSIIVMGHYGHWEWAGNTFSIVSRQQSCVIYKPISNKYFDGLMLRMRTRFGAKLIATRNTYREMLSMRKQLTVTTFIADQTPPPEGAYWTTFLNQDTPIFKGTEVIAKKLNLPVVYASVNRIKRGVYELHAEMLAEHPAETADGEISEMHTRRLERDIIAHPETWLWSHKRWKHKRPVE